MPGKKYSFGGGGSGQELELPTIDENGEHHTVLVKKLSPQDLLSTGLLDQLDSLTALVKTDHLDRVEGKGKWASGEGPAPELTEEQMIEVARANPQGIHDMFRVVGKVVALAVVEPKVYPLPEGDQDQLPGRTYVDEVPLQNQLAILNFAIGDMKVMEPFREGSEADVAGLPNGRNSRKPAKRTPRAK